MRFTISTAFKILVTSSITLIACGPFSTAPSSTSTTAGSTSSQSSDDASNCRTTVTDQGWLLVSCPGYAPYMSPPQVWLAPVVRNAAVAPVR